MLAKDSLRRSVAQAKSAYKMMELAGRFAAGDQWTDACALVCYRASEELRSKLFSAEYNILDELHQRIAHTGNILEELYESSEDEQLHDVMSFWGRLNDYRERNCSRLLQICEKQFATPKQASYISDNFKHHELWYDLTLRQNKANARETRSTQYFTKDQDGPMQLKLSWNMDCQSLSNELNLMMLQSTSTPLDN